MFWLYLLVIAATEILILLTNSIVGLVLYALLLATLVIHTTLSSVRERQDLVRALLLLPLMRILAITLPLGLFPPLARYPIVGVPLLVATVLVIRQSKLAHADLGLHTRHVLQQVMLIGAGPVIGAVQYAILQPQPLITAFSWDTILFGALIVFVFIGFAEELIFRGLLLQLASGILGRFAVTYVALLFAVLSISYGSPAQTVFMFGIALFFGSVVRWTGSILGVVLAHGLSCVTFYLVLPYAVQHPTPVIIQRTFWTIAAGSALAIGALGMLLVDRIFGRRTFGLAALATVATNWSNRPKDKPTPDAFETTFKGRLEHVRRRKSRLRRTRRQRKQDRRRSST